MLVASADPNLILTLIVDAGTSDQPPLSPTSPLPRLTCPDAYVESCASLVAPSPGIAHLQQLSPPLLDGSPDPVGYSPSIQCTGSGNYPGRGWRRRGVPCRALSPSSRP